MEEHVSDHSASGHSLSLPQNPCQTTRHLISISGYGFLVCSFPHLCLLKNPLMCHILFATLPPLSCGAAFYHFLLLDSPSMCHCFPRTSSGLPITGYCSSTTHWTCILPATYTWPRASSEKTQPSHQFNNALRCLTQSANSSNISLRSVKTLIPTPKQPGSVLTNSSMLPIACAVLNLLTHIPQHH